jgi:hypothetical protein
VTQRFSASRNTGTVGGEQNAIVTPARRPMVWRDKITYISLDQVIDSVGSSRHADMKIAAALSRIASARRQAGGECTLFGVCPAARPESGQ